MEVLLVNLPVACSVNRTTRKLFAWTIVGVTVECIPVSMRSSLKSVSLDASKHPQLICFPCAFIMDRGSRKTSVSNVGLQNNCACVKIWLDF